MVAFQELQRIVEECQGDAWHGLELFLSKDDGWKLPETIRLADFGLGTDDRATHAQPVAVTLGPRYVDWQLAQSVEESWREVRMHTRNLLGEDARSRSANDGVKASTAGVGDLVSVARMPNDSTQTNLFG
jgi:hypothetical protein